MYQCKTCATINTEDVTCKWCGRKTSQKKEVKDMKTFTVEVEYEGYSRGKAVIKVNAETEEEAIANASEGYGEYLDPIRDDTTKDYTTATIV